MTEAIRLLVLLVGMGLCIIALWPHRALDVTLSRGAANRLEPEPSYRFAPCTEQREVAGVYMRDGRPRYMLMGKDATADEFKRAMTPQGWEQAQAWIAARSPH